MAEISQVEWQEHMDEDKQQTLALHRLNLAIFGDPEKPDTVRCSLRSTMTRINAFIDVWKWIGAVLIGLGVTAPAWVPLLKMLLHELAK